jgi:hypothetical protein
VLKSLFPATFCPLNQSCISCMGNAVVLSDFARAAYSKTLVDGAQPIGCVMHQPRCSSATTVEHERKDYSLIATICGFAAPATFHFGKSANDDRAGCHFIINRGTSEFPNAPYVTSTLFRTGDVWDQEWDQGAYCADLSQAFVAFKSKVDDALQLSSGVQMPSGEIAWACVYPAREPDERCFWAVHDDKCQNSANHVEWHDDLRNWVATCESCRGAAAVTETLWDVVAARKG